MKELKAVLEAAPDAMLLVDSSGNIVIANKQVEALFGFAADELTGKPVELLIPSRYRGAHSNHQKTYFKSPWRRDMGHAAVELFGCRKDGSEFDAEISLGPLELDGASYVLASIRDGSLRKRTEARLRRILEAAPDPILIVDKQGTITFVNRQTERVFGYEKNELIGKTVEMLVPARFAGVHPSHRAHYGEHPRPRPMGAGLRLFARRKDGSEFPCEISLSPLETDTGTETMAAVRDITERFEAEEREKQLIHERNARELAEQAVRARDEFLSIASHELRTPLTSMLMRLQSLIRQAGTGKLDYGKIGSSLELPLRAANRLAGLIEQLLDVSRISSGRLKLSLEPTDLPSLIHVVIDQFSTESEKAGCTIAYAGPDHLSGLWDANRIDQVLTNLLGNAIKYGSGKPIEITLSSAANYAVLSVADHGIGIEPDQQARIFDRFERAVSDRTYGGLGLGLFITKQIVELHGGRIEVLSRPGEGSTFTVSLPIEAKEISHVT